MLEIQDAKLAYREVVVASNLNLAVPQGCITTIVGPNGSGKSTVLRALARVLTPAAGAVLLDGKQIDRWHTNEVARRLAMLPQAPHAPDGLTVRDLVANGRFPHQGWFSGNTQADVAAIRRALADVNLEDLALRPVASLSGGQRQRAWIAMALAQQTHYLLLDEPTTFLDMAHQIDLLDLLGRLNRQAGKTIVMVLHDLNLAARVSTHMVVIAAGRVLCQGPPADIMRPDVLAAAFDIEAVILRDPVSGAPVCIPQGLAGNHPGLTPALPGRGGWRT